MNLKYFFLLLFLHFTDAFACTGWLVKDHQGLHSESAIWFVKNRDHLQTKQWLEFRKSKLETQEHAYMGLYALNEKGKPALKAGINSHTLAIASLTASSISLEQRNTCTANISVLKMILEKYASVTEVLEHAEEIFPRSKPQFIMLADRDQIAMVEIAPPTFDSPCDPDLFLENQFYIHKGQDFLTHANHFLAPELAKFNKTPTSLESSLHRWQRINDLLEQQHTEITFDKMTQWAHDTESGPNDSLFRYPPFQDEEIHRTVASWIVKIPKYGDPELKVIFYKHGGSGITASAFWGTSRAVSPSTSLPKLFKE